MERSDVHGAIFPYDFINDKASKTSLAQVMTYVNEERAVLDQEVVLLDNGDILQGQPVYDQIVKDFNFPWLAANAVHADTGEQYFEPYKVIYRNGAGIPKKDLGARIKSSTIKDLRYYLVKEILL